jgi:hypothetical protein
VRETGERIRWGKLEVDRALPSIADLVQCGGRRESLAGRDDDRDVEVPTTIGA